MKQTKIYIDEENIYFFWALIAVVCIGGATYMLANAFISQHGSFTGYGQILGLILLALGGYSIIKITSPLFRFILEVENSVLTIEIWGEEDRPINTKHISLHNIESLRISPHSPRSSREALFDFATNYHLLCKLRSSGEYEPLIFLNGQSFTLKVKDIRKIIRFLHSYQSTIKIPSDQELFVN